MRIGQLSEHFFFSGQIEPEHVSGLAGHGFKTIVCNRPDGEDWGQPTAAEISAVAEEHGMEFIHIPVVSAASPKRMSRTSTSNAPTLRVPCCCIAARVHAARSYGNLPQTSQATPGIMINDNKRACL